MKLKQVTTEIKNYIVSIQYDQLVIEFTCSPELHCVITSSLIIQMYMYINLIFGNDKKPAYSSQWLPKCLICPDLTTTIWRLYADSVTTVN